MGASEHLDNVETGVVLVGMDPYEYYSHPRDYSLSQWIVVAVLLTLCLCCCCCCCFLLCRYLRRFIWHVFNTFSLWNLQEEEEDQCEKGGGDHPSGWLRENRPRMQHEKASRSNQSPLLHDGITLPVDAAPCSVLRDDEGE